jgi:hypothetical protein
VRIWDRSSPADLVDALEPDEVASIRFVLKRAGLVIPGMGRPTAIPGCLPHLSRSRRVRITDPFTGTAAGLRVPVSLPSSS